MTSSSHTVELDRVRSESDIAWGRDVLGLHLLVLVQEVLQTADVTLGSSKSTDRVDQLVLIDFTVCNQLLSRSLCSSERSVQMTKCSSSSVDERACILEFFSASETELVKCAAQLNCKFTDCCAGFSSVTDTMLDDSPSITEDSSN